MGDNTQAQGHFSCECLPDHHWDSARGREDKKDSIKLQTLGYGKRGGINVAEPTRGSCYWGFLSHLVWNTVLKGRGAVHPRDHLTVISAPVMANRLHTALLIAKGCSLQRVRTLAFPSILTVGLDDLIFAFPNLMILWPETSKPCSQCPPFQGVS